MMNGTGAGPAALQPQAPGPLQVLVLWADDSSPNLGVRALGRGTAALVRRVWPDAAITFVNYGHGSPHLPMGRLRSLVREQVTGRRGMQKWLSGFDLVIDTRSGDSFADIYGLKRHSIMTAVAACVRRAGIPLVLGPQTVGPFNSKRGRLLARGSLSSAKVLMVRDAESADAAARLGRAVDVQSTDVVFAMEVPQVEKSRDVILNISGLLWNPNPHVDFRSYRDIVTRLHDGLLAQGRQLTLLAHVLDPYPGVGTQQPTSKDNDVPAIREFMNCAQSQAEVLIPRDLDEVRAAVASGNVVIGSRMHACLNALSVGTPAIPLAYSRKFEPLLRDLGWQHTVDLRDTSTDPVAAVLHQLGADAMAGDLAALSENAQRLLLRAEQALRSLS